LIDFCYDASEWFRDKGIKRNHAGDEIVRPCWAFCLILVMISCLSAIVAMLVLGFQWFTSPVASSYSSIDGKCGFNSFVLVFAAILFVVGIVLQFFVLAKTKQGSIVTSFLIGMCASFSSFPKIPFAFAK
jgi:hypothetical protein